MVDEELFAVECFCNAREVRACGFGGWKDNRPDRFPDFILHEGEATWGAEFATIDFPQHRRQAAEHRGYLTALLAAVGPPNWPTGVRALISVDFGRIPSVRSRTGCEIVRRLATTMQIDSSVQASLKEGRLRRLDVPCDDLDVGKLRVFLVPDFSSDLPAIDFDGCLVTYGDEAVQQLAVAIERKLEKFYSPSREQRLMLVVYSRTVLFERTGEEVQRACALLDSRAHPFDEVWCLFPFSRADSLAWRIWCGRSSSRPSAD